MSQIYVGWCDCNEFQLVPQEQASFSSVAEAEKYATLMNDHEQAKNGDSEWFVLVGEPVCQKPCSNCEPDFELHHWLVDSVIEEENDEIAEDSNSERAVCKHCETWRTLVDSDE